MASSPIRPGLDLLAAMAACAAVLAVSPAVAEAPAAIPQFVQTDDIQPSGPADDGSGGSAPAETKPGDSAQDGAPGRTPGATQGTTPGATPGTTPGAPVDGGYVPPAVQTDVTALPFPARRMRELLMEAARSGDIERLRPYIGSGDDVTLFSFGGVAGDPIAFLKSISGDDEGHEILAILLEVLEAGFVHIEAGTENEMYVWPYFFAVPLKNLTPPQRVDLFKLLTYGDFQEMDSFGAYFFYRVGITPQGRWRFFVAGD